MITNTAYIIYLIEHLLQQNISQEALFFETNLCYETLKSTLDINLLSHKSVLTLLENCIRISNNPGLGLQFGDLLDSCLHGPVGKLIMTSSNLTEAITNGVCYSGVISSLVELTLKRSDQQTKIVASSIYKNEVEMFLMEGIFTSIRKMIYHLIPNHRIPLSIKLRYGPPKYSKIYSHYFDQVKFNQVHNELQISNSYMALPINFANEFSNQLALAECKKLFHLQAKQNNLLTLIPKIISQNPRLYSNLTTLASSLSMSPRTLHRKLVKQQTSFRQLLTDTRVNLAKYYLVRTELSVAEIADRLGYSDPSNFTNSFKRVTQQAPIVYRETHHHETT